MSAYQPGDYRLRRCARFQYERVIDCNMNNISLHLKVSLFYVYKSTEVYLIHLIFSLCSPTLDQLCPFLHSQNLSSHKNVMFPASYALMLT
jgi:hypothetical protein